MIFIIYNMIGIVWQMVMVGDGGIVKARTGFRDVCQHSSSLPSARCAFSGFFLDVKVLLPRQHKRDEKTIEIDSSIWREEIGNRNRLFDLAGRNRQ